MHYFYPVTDSDFDIVGFYKLVNDKQAVVKAYTIMCFPHGMSEARFRQLMRRFPTQPVQIATHTKIYPYNGKQHMATWALDSPIAADDEAALKQLYRNIWELMKEVLEERVSDFEFAIQLVAYRKDDTEMNKSYYLERIPSCHNIWGPREATITAKIDSFLDLAIKDLPENLRYIWFENIKESVLSAEPIPELVKVHEDHVEVTWRLMKGEDLTSTFDWLFFDLATNFSQRDKFKKGWKDVLPSR
ncbi:MULTISPECIES: hypothetical protein [unclassified Paenibacillus]|uniref:hypothetical protein n=1 Tax=unclassified Paenibacillus TaxID=185978 RepID=UPI001AE4AF8F|nr:MULTISPECIES: hypothetical protein [unclassified Paenibacillus]MBP1157683.1 hypothetical protein [Paenibacillus sp. PvP091]MBP1171580.1 hypothetical protein [Paenibacillus sp. PvR098]MBP2437961.1 hypothetical protein [Paenibacillus sp. PvP052]